MFIPKTNSTNSLLQSRIATGEIHDMDWLATDYQTAGRGQTGNTWESEQGKNILFSIAVQPAELPIELSFRLSMWVSVAIAQVLNGMNIKTKSGEDIRFQIKWPNDIYAGDRKVAGILIENMLQGKSIGWSIVGIGLNVNQTVFLSDAPNPVSLAMLTEKEWDRATIIQNLIATLQSWRPYLLPASDNTDILRETYGKNMYRHEGFYPYVEREVSVAPTAIAQEKNNQCFEAEMIGVTDNGELQLRLRSGEKRQYHFKQIRFVIE